MIKNFTLFFLFLNIAFIQAQDCMPVELPTDTSIIVPGPYDEATMLGGIASACINEEYEQVLTLKIPQTVPFGGVEIAIDSASIATEGGIEGLPVGINYSCNPPSCIFVSDVPGCILLSGTPDATNPEGQYDLSLEITAFSIIPLTIQYPDDIPDVDGTYFIDVYAEGSVECDGPSSNNDLLSRSFAISNQPNPFSDHTEIKIESTLNKTVEFLVMDFTGKLVRQEMISLQVGSNIISLDSSQLAEGMYAYLIRDGQNTLSNKMVLNR